MKKLLVLLFTIPAMFVIYMLLVSLPLVMSTIVFLFDRFVMTVL